MTLRQLRYLIAVAEAESFTRAAERLLVSQPALSHQIRALERSTGTALLDRRPCGVALTQEGRDDAQTLAATLNHAALNIGNALGAWLGGLAIAAGGGWASPSWVGVGLAFGALAILTVSVALERRRG